MIASDASAVSGYLSPSPSPTGSVSEEPVHVRAAASRPQRDQGNDSILLKSGAASIVSSSDATAGVKLLAARLAPGDQKEVLFFPHEDFHDAPDGTDAIAGFGSSRHTSSVGFWTLQMAIRGMESSPADIVSTLRGSGSNSSIQVIGQGSACNSVAMWPTGFVPGESSTREAQLPGAVDA